MANMILYLNDFKNKASFKFFVCSMLSHEATFDSVLRATSGYIDLHFEINSDGQRKIEYFLDLSSADHTAYDKLLTDAEFKNYIQLRLSQKKDVSK